MQPIPNIRRYLRNRWIAVFWKRPHHLWALKVCLSVSMLLIPMVFSGNSAYGITLAMGVIAMSLSETDSHPRGRIKSFAITLVAFLIASTVIELLYPAQPLLFTLWLGIGIFVILLLGGISVRWQSISFGTVLISVYAMIGAKVFEQWYIQPLLLTFGAFCYGIISWGFLIYRPTRLLEEQLALAFFRLSEYLEMKSKLFPSPTVGQEERRNELAQKNVEVVQQIEKCRIELSRYAYESGNKSLRQADWIYRHWLLLQELHERATSSHERYDILSHSSQPELIEGFGVYMSGIASALKFYGDTLLTESRYKHPIALRWTSSALSNILQLHNDSQHGALSLLFKNLNRIENTLCQLAERLPETELSIPYAERPYHATFSELFNFRHPRFRFAIRMSLSFLVGYAIMYYFEIQNGEWIILTSLLVNQQTYSATRQRLWHRIIGTVVGVVLGGLISDLLPTKIGQTLLYLGSVYAFFYWVRQRYTTAVVFITIFVMSAFNIQSGQGLEVLLPRLTDTFIGAIIAYLSVRLLWVDWQYKQLPLLVHNALSANRAYFESIINNIPIDGFRSQAHITDNALTTAWKSMSVEPKKKRFSQQTAYKLTFLNHALLSYISAFSIQGYGKQLTEEEQFICKNISEIIAQASDALSGNNFSELNIENYRATEKNLLKLKLEGDNPKIILLHNITRISVDLLSEISTGFKKS